jgi:large subunit ribosomal protein L35
MLVALCATEMTHLAPEPQVRALPRASASIHRSMPKMKTHSGAKKRFRKTAKGKLRARHSFTSHYLGHKSAKRKRHLGRPVVVADADRKRVQELLHK